MLGVAVALAGPAVFGVLAAPGGIELNAKGMALAFGIGALVFWAVVSYFSGAGALGAFVAFGTLVYCWLWIPNRTTNFLNDVPGVTNGMIDGTKQYTLNGVVPILGVISLVYAVQLIVRAVQRRRRERAEAERLQREQEAAQAQQEADVAAVYPVAAGTYQAPAAYQGHSSYDDLFDEPEPVRPRNQADEQTRQFPVGGDEEFEQTRPFPAPDADSNKSDETVAAAPVAEKQAEPVADEPTAPAPVTEAPAASVGKQEPEAQETSAAVSKQQSVAGSEPTAEASAVPGEQEAVGAPAPVADEATVPVAKQEVVGAPAPVADEPTVPAAKQEPVAAPGPVADEPTVPAAKQESVAAPAPVVGESAAPVVKQEAAAEQPAVDESAAGESAAGETKPVEAKPVEAKAAEARSADSKAEATKVEESPKVSPKEQVGSQYRERMENPEDTGEFFLAFENPAVKPA
ncbi:hypothetical protein GCM10009630_72460 [Kribbella jejuensis]